MKKSIILVTLLLAGCNNDPGFNTDYERPKPQEESKHFELWYNPELSGPFVDRIEGHWVDIQTCVGIAAPEVFDKVEIRYLPREQMPDGYTIGIYYFHSMKALINQVYIEPQWDHVVRHELIHHLLHIAGHPVEDNRNHEPAWIFNTCIYDDWQNYL